MIRNYRLHLVMNSESELPPEERAILGLNHGTTIYVNNSIIKPEMFHYTTNVDDNYRNATMPKKKEQKKKVRIVKGK
jgi:hypothetical protein